MLVCSALGGSRSGFHAWRTRKPSQRTRDNERNSTMARADFLASDRTNGAHRVWHDVLAHGVDCGLHKIERLMRQGALQARPRRRGRPKALPHHSGRGSQYSSEGFQRLMADHGVTCSMSRSGNVWDNAAMESFFSSLKTGRLTRRIYRTRDAAGAAAFDDIERFYNLTRHHSAIGYPSPVAFERLASSG